MTEPGLTVADILKAKRLMDAVPVQDTMWVDVSKLPDDVVRWLRAYLMMADMR